jgi:protein SCO1/2
MYAQPDGTGDEGANRMRRVALLGILVLLTAAACAAAKSYSATGLVLRVDRKDKTIVISHDAIPGYMNAMAMTFPVHDGKSLEGLQPGTMVEFTLVVKDEGAYVDKIRVREYQGTAQEPMAARQLKILGDATAAKTDTTKPLGVGEAVPDFTLVSQNRETVSFSQFSGKVVAITFIYTSCPLPNFCFRMSNNFGALQKRFAEELGKDVVLLSVTFDPVHDQPEVLAEYASTWKSDTAGWFFLTGPVADIQRVCNLFGMNFSQDEGLMTHSLHTAVIDRQGKLAANLEGNEYTAEQLGDLVKEVMSRGN